MANYSSSYTGAQIDSAVGRANSTDVTAGTVTASKAVVVDANSDISGFRNITATGQIQAATINLTGDTTIGDGDTDNITINADVNSNIIPNTDNTFDLGSSSKQWKDLYVNGIGYIDQLGTDADPIAIYASSGEIDGTVIGSESAAAGTFTTLTASDDVTFDTSTLKVDSTNNRVGIGTASPDKLLEVSGATTPTIRITDTTSASHSAGDVHGAIEWYSEDVSNDWPGVQAYISAVQSGTSANPHSDLYFQASESSSTPEGNTGTNPHMVIQSTTGNVGIGTASPVSVLDLGSATEGEGIAWGGASGTAHYATIWTEYGNGSLIMGAGLKGSTSASTFLNPHTGTYGYAAIELDSFSDDGIKFYVGADSSKTKDASITPSEAMRIDTSGNVGINETNPDRKLHVNSGATNACAIFESTDTEVVIELKDSTGTAQIASRNDFRFTAGSSERMRVDSSGNVLIGRTSVGTTGNGHSIRGADSAIFSRDGGEAVIMNRDSSDGLVLEFRRNGSTSVGKITALGSERIAIHSGTVGIEFNPSNQVNPSNGSGGLDNTLDLGASTSRWDDIYATNTTIQSSDERMKDEIIDSPIGLSFINDLRPVQYKWKDYDDKTFSRKHYGLIAQEVEQVLSDNDINTNDFAPLVYDEESDRYGMRYGEMVGILIKAVQELSAKVEALENA